MILQAIFNHGSIENPSVPIGSGWDFGQSTESAAGVHISRDGAMKLSAFWRGVNLRSDYIARLPLEVKLKTDRGKAPDTDHPAYPLLMYQPNPEVNAFTLKKTAEHHQIVSGNGYVYILRRGSGAPAELWNLDPDNTWPVRVNGRLSYVTRIDYGEGRTEMRNLLKEDVIHLKGLGWDGLCGYPFLRVMANTLGLSTAANEYAARFFRNNAEPRVVIEMPGTMTMDAQTQFIEQWNKMHQGLESAHRTAIITGGGKINPFSIKASDAQLLDQRKFSLVEIANGLGMPPHKVGASDRIAYNSLEQENQAFADDTLEPRMSEWEQELHNKLLTEREKMLDTHCIRFDRNELVRADLVARATAMEKAVKGPWMTPDEARSGEGLSPYPGPEGDKLLIPEKPEPKAPQQQNSQSTPSGGASIEEIEDRLRPIAGKVDHISGSFEQFANAVRADIGTLGKQLTATIGNTLNGLKDDIIAFKTEVRSEIVGCKAEFKTTAEGITIAIVNDNANTVQKFEEIRVREVRLELEKAHAESLEFLLLESCARIAERIAKDSEKAVKALSENPRSGKLTEWLADLENRHATPCIRSMKPVMEACAPICSNLSAPAVVTAVIEKVRRDLGVVVSGTETGGLAGAITEWAQTFPGNTKTLVDNWTSTADPVAKMRAMRAGSTA